MNTKLIILLSGFIFLQNTRAMQKEPLIIVDYYAESLSNSDENNPLDATKSFFNKIQFYILIKELYETSKSLTSFEDCFDESLATAAFKNQIKKTGAHLCTALSKYPEEESIDENSKKYIENILKQLTLFLNQFSVNKNTVFNVAF